MSPVDIFGIGGNVGADLSNVDWDATPLGAPAQWPASLTGMLRVVLTSRFSMWMAWGQDLTFFCNDAYRRDTLGAKYPWALGRPAWEVWGEIWEDIGPRIASVLADGVATWDESLLLFLERSGYREETYHTFSYSPLADDDGRTVGMLCVVAEDTERVIAERRMATLRDLGMVLAGAATEGEVLDHLVGILDTNRRDVPYSVTVLVDDDGDRSVRTSGAATTGTVLAADGFGSSAVAVDTRDVLAVVPSIDGSPVERAIVWPLAAQAGAEPFGWFVAGLNPHRPADEQLHGFSRLVASQLAAAVTSTRALESERRRALALQELDRVKSRFFANVSHEFRTPLTLIMDPIAQLRDRLSSADPDVAADLEMVHRNALRLGKLVNTVLDFSRLQAGRTDASFEPVDLCELTTDLAGMFRPAFDAAGLALRVECDPLHEPVYVDVGMWEKVVLNLLSNALKFTLDGSVAVRLQHHGTDAVLTVSDTGVGIPDEELPRLFERFHRVEHTRARSSEGSGIGLALVAELVELHGGQVSATSRLGEGTSFTVSVPLGHAHLPVDQVRSQPRAERRSDAAEAYLAETSRWMPDDHAPSEPADDERLGRVVVVDDNADMRSYLARVLGRRFRVSTATNGAEALAIVSADPPDLVLSDVMMPEIDGLELVRRMRADDRLADIPVVLLTAAAGPEQTVEGLGLGADDYLAKPFSADRLLDRVTARITAGLERRQRRALADLAVALSRCHSEQDALSMAYPVLERWLGATGSTLGVEHEQGLLRMTHVPGYGRGIDQRYLSSTVEAPLPTTDAFRSASTLAIGDRTTLVERYPHLRVDIEESGAEALVTTPIVRADDRVIGVLGALWDEPRTFTSGDLSFVTRIASLLGDALARLHEAERERRLAAEFQERLLEIDNRSDVGVVAARYRPADSALLVGGDWYDVGALRDGSLAVSVGDVVGKGLAAAIVMSQLRSAVRMASLHFEDPGRALAEVDEYASWIPEAQCASAASLRLCVDGLLTWSCAGHLPPLLVEQSGASYLMTGRRSVIGLNNEASIEQASKRLHPGDLVVLFTDGLVERRGEHLDTGLDRLAEEVWRHRHLPAGELCDHLVAAMEPAGGYGDDVVVVAIRCLSRTAERFVDVIRSTPSQLRVGRAAFQAWLAEAEIGERDAADAVLAYSEVVGNAIEHGNNRHGDRTVGIEAFTLDGQLHLTVTDSGRWHADAARSQQAGRGRGFAIMNAITDHVEVRDGRLGTTVSLRRTLSSPVHR